MIDTHCHLTDERFDGRLDEVVAEAKEAGVERILMPTTGLLDLKKGIAIADKYPDVWVMAGIHPENVSEFRDRPRRAGSSNTRDSGFSGLEELIKSSKKVVGIGEIGLDFHYDKEKISKEIQIGIFKGQVELANKLNLPVMIHMRDAEEEMTEILKNLDEIPRGQFHCWSGSEKFLSMILEMGFYVSFCGNITFKSAQNLRELVKKVPLERLLLETDSPYLSPEPLRGGINTPSNVKITASYIANLLQIQDQTLINQTTQNALCLYFAG